MMEENTGSGDFSRFFGRAPGRLREDRLALAGLALLGLLTMGVVQLYRSAPQSIAEAGNRSLLAALPDAFTPRMTRAEGLLESARQSALAGADSVALVTFADAGEQAARAMEAASGGEERQRAIDLAARSYLGRARLTGRIASERGLRPDDRAGLASAIVIADSALALAPSSPVRLEAETLLEELRRERRIGPLEWLPGGR